MGLLRVLLISGLGRSWRLKFSGELLLTSVKLLSKADFRNLPWGHFYSRLKIVKISKMAIKLP